MELKKLNKTVKMEAPKGYHWMLEKGRYYLMAGDYKPHTGAVKEAEFRMVSHAPAKGKAEQAMNLARQAKKS